MIQLQATEVQQVAGGKWVVTDPTVPAMTAGYVIGVTDTAFNLGIISGNTDFSVELAALTLFIGNDGAYSQFDIDRALSSLIWI